jgi:uncharacterized membrane protein YjfL (UPF0719 family)
MKINKELFRFYATIFIVAVIVVVSFYFRVPAINRDLVGYHDWKSIRHFQFAASMLESGNPFFGTTSFTSLAAFKITGRMA